MPISTRLALLALSVSVLPMAAHAETPSPWVYGIDERADAAGLPKRVRKAKVPAPAPSPTPTPILPTNTTGAGILVGIVDTGIDLDHPEFAGRIAAGGACFGDAWTCSGSAAFGDDDHGHGTHVAGIVAAAANGTGNTGVAPDALLLPVKVLDASGSGSYAAVGAGISYAASSGARVINMSLGGSSPSSTLLTPLKQAATTAVIVAAAGNSGNVYAPGYPAAYATQPGVVGSMIIVGSVGSNNKISSFSQTPGKGGCVTSGGKKTCFKDVFLVAPGQSIYSTYMGGGYAIMSGTSMATPYVSGVAAAVLGASPFLTPQQVASIMFESAIDLGAKGTDPIYGRGLVNLPGALAPLGTQTIATSGATTSTARGARRLRKSRVSGVLSAGLRGSQIARDVVFFDSYGRDYRTDLTGAAGTNAISLTGVIAQNGQTGRGFLFAGDSFSISGFVADEAPNAVALAGFADRQVVDVSDVVVTAKLSDDTSMIVGHDASLAGHMNKLDLAASEAYDGLFMSASALNSPFMALTSDATFVGAALDLGDGFTFTAGHGQSEETGTSVFEDEILSTEEAVSYLSQDNDHLRSAQNTVASMSWRFAPWGVAGLNVAHTSETNSLLGTTEQGALALTAEAATTSVGFGARANLGDDWVASVSWSRGETDAAPVADGLFNGFSSIESQAYGIALSKHGVFGKDDSIGFAVSRPLHITRGSAVMTASTGVTDDREILYSTEVVNLASATPETDFEIGYSASLDDGVTLLANGMYQQDVGSEPGEAAIAAFLTLKTVW